MSFLLQNKRLLDTSENIIFNCAAIHDLQKFIIFESEKTQHLANMSDQTRQLVASSNYILLSHRVVVYYQHV